VSLPILRNHDPNAVLGVVERTDDDGRYIAEFKPRTVTQTALLGLGGGWRVLELEEEGEQVYVRRAELICFGTDPTREALENVHAAATLERCWREFLAQHPEVRAMPRDHVDKIKRVWLDGAQSAQQVLVDSNPDGPHDLARVRVVCRDLADGIMAEITRIHGREH
jgi:hypothetical protein